MEAPLGRIMTETQSAGFFTFGAIDEPEARRRSGDED